MVKVGACAVGDEDITVSINTDDVSVLWGVDSFFSCLGIFRGDPHYIQQHLDNRHFTKAVASLLHLQSIVVGASSSGEGVLACFSWAAATRWSYKFPFQNRLRVLIFFHQSILFIDL
jgi:hypothetical protein